jgi:hypothetical protein
MAFEMDDWAWILWLALGNDIRIEWPGLDIVISLS